ncbi:MAG: Insertion element protein [Thermodesulfobacteriota bacterium]
MDADSRIGEPTEEGGAAGGAASELPACPRCGGGAVYRYGHDRHGTRRCRCQVCGRQFSLGHTRPEMDDRPACPVCGSRMHICQRAARGLVLRCAAYPICRTYHRIELCED